ncbi:hypothetical protein M501DRAFT_938591 [Patellaria atrata CBS 101060]|uniref:N-alpha-acetyltransferase 40 n=1 Tax=Patellaria atrata CBS 101060 TaxID=1346257 RepID=A0A9P4S6U4_9PEZI|nr:hypothetical protein M501DRAFT_938591 [Patellaria atrata CBS 101060]
MTESSSIPASLSSHLEHLNKLSPSTFAEKYLPLDDPLLTFSPLTEPSTTYTITLVRSAHLTTTDFTTCFSLIEVTSSAAYRNSSRGWHPGLKQAEMKETDMRYLLVRRASTSPSSPSPILGFLSFQLTPEPPDIVLYVYEIHLSASLRGCGLGTHLMGVAEELARRTGMRKTLLTVFTSNIRGEKFYRNLGYQEDDISPASRELRGGKVKRPDYIILSKEVEGP